MSASAVGLLTANSGFRGRLDIPGFLKTNRDPSRISAALPSLSKRCFLIGGSWPLAADLLSNGGRKGLLNMSVYLIHSSAEELGCLL